MTDRFLKPLTLGSIAAALTITSCKEPAEPEPKPAPVEKAKTSGVSKKPEATEQTAGSAPSATGKWEDWAQFRGPRNGNAPALPQAEASKLSLTKLWISPTDSGFSSFSVAGSQAFTLVTRDGKETLVALDAKRGKELWAKSLADAKYDGGGDSGDRNNRGGDGARSTPTINDGKVYVIDGTVVLFCFDAKDGKELWKYDVLKETSGENIRWESAQSPVIDGDLVLLAGGGKGKALMALDKKTGAVKWQAENDAMTHATPVLAEILGTHQCIFFTQTGLVSVEPQSGKVLWRAPFDYNTSTAASPVVFEDIVYCSAGYKVGAGAFKIAKEGDSFKAAEIWRKEGNDLANHWSTPVVKDGLLYGMFGFKKYDNGPLACVDIRTGDVKWEQEGYGPGQVILSGDTIIALTDKGEVVFVKAEPSKYVELKREAIITGKVWSYPVLAGNFLLGRSTKEGGCWELK
jgi:outer membrane protein assembly factor BamB